MVLQRYRAKAELGKGSFGTVYLTEGRRDKKPYVVKVVDNLREGSLKVQEIRVMMHLKHRNICTMCDFYTSNNQLCIVMDFADGGDLRKEIMKARNGKTQISEDLISCWIIQVCHALDYAHEEQIIHRDMKPSNIFLMADGHTVRVGDFGISKVLDEVVKQAEPGSKEEGRVGTKRYMAPEVLNREDYSNKADVWSLGCVLFELLTLNHPTYEQDRRIWFEWVPANYSPAIKDALKACLTEAPGARPAPRELLHTLATAKAHVPLVQQTCLEGLRWLDETMLEMRRKLEAQAAALRPFAAEAHRQTDIPAFSHDALLASSVASATHVPVPPMPRSAGAPTAGDSAAGGATPVTPAAAAVFANKERVVDLDLGRTMDASWRGATPMVQSPPPEASPSTAGEEETVVGTGLVLSIDRRTGVISVCRMVWGGTAERSQAVSVGDIVHELDGRHVYRKYTSLAPAGLAGDPAAPLVVLSLQRGPHVNQLTRVTLPRARSDGGMVGGLPQGLALVLPERAAGGGGGESGAEAFEHYAIPEYSEDAPEDAPYAPGAPAPGAAGRVAPATPLAATLLGLAARVPPGAGAAGRTDEAAPAASGAALAVYPLVPATPVPAAPQALASRVPNGRTGDAGPPVVSAMVGVVESLPPWRLSGPVDPSVEDGGRLQAPALLLKQPGLHTAAPLPDAGVQQAWRPSTIASSSPLTTPSLPGMFSPSKGAGLFPCVDSPTSNSTTSLRDQTSSAPLPSPQSRKSNTSGFTSIESAYTSAGRWGGGEGGGGAPIVGPDGTVSALRDSFGASHLPQIYSDYTPSPEYAVQAGGSSGAAQAQWDARSGASSERRVHSDVRIDLGRSLDTRYADAPRDPGNHSSYFPGRPLQQPAAHAPSGGPASGLGASAGPLAGSAMRRSYGGDAGRSYGGGGDAAPQHGLYGSSASSGRDHYSATPSEGGYPPSWEASGGGGAPGQHRLGSTISLGASLDVASNRSVYNAYSSQTRYNGASSIEHPPANISNNLPSSRSAQPSAFALAAAAANNGAGAGRPPAPQAGMPPVPVFPGQGDTNRVLEELERVRSGIQATLAAALASGRMPGQGGGGGGMSSSVGSAADVPRVTADRDVLVTKASSWGDASATAGTSVQYPDQARTALAAAAAGGAGGMGHQPQGLEGQGQGQKEVGSYAQGQADSRYSFAEL